MRHVIAIVAALIALAMSARTQDTASANVVPIQITGDASSRFSLVVLGDGYLASERDKFRAHLDRHLNILWSIEPFRSYRNYFNVYAVEIASPQSGIDCDPEIRERRTTPLAPAVRRRLHQHQRARGDGAAPGRVVVAAVCSSGDAGAQARSRSSATATPTAASAADLRRRRAEMPSARSSRRTSLGTRSAGSLDEYTYVARGKAGGSYEGGEPATVHMTTVGRARTCARAAEMVAVARRCERVGRTIARFEGGSGYTRESGVRAGTR